MVEPLGFIEEIIKKRLNAAYVVVGSDWSFGRDRAGNIDVLKAAQKLYRYEAVVLEKELYNHREISSSWIREKKKENLPRKPKQHKHYNEGKKRYYKKKDDKPSETAPQEEGEKTETPVVKLPETQTAEVKVGQAKSLKELLG